ncbi:hypothetical protein AcV5_010414 [Taiwanofungus camphoratus]|nr:hypothetical protein AcV5_010414 [Antrodia cinnamomea]
MTARPSRSERTLLIRCARDEWHKQRGHVHLCRLENSVFEMDKVVPQFSHWHADGYLMALDQCSSCFGHDSSVLARISPYSDFAYCAVQLGFAMAHDGTLIDGV